jgi:class 3 adenylate cyclase
MERAEHTERRLAAILSADVAGYSRMMAEDEAATVREVKRCREIIGARVREHRGLRRFARRQHPRRVSECGGGVDNGSRAWCWGFDIYASKRPSD